MPEITLLSLLQHGVHFGHQASRRHPKMQPYIFGTRGGISIINLESTRTTLTQAANAVRDVVGRGGTVMFVGTKRQARDIVATSAAQAGMPAVTDRWIGGLFTNFSEVKALIEKLAKLKTDRAAGEWTKYVKKEQLELEREIIRLEKLVGNLGNLSKLPDAIYVVDIKHEKTAVREAKLMGIPVIAICDTNVNPVDITYPIPANDDATKSIRLVTDIIVQAVADGRTQHDQQLRALAAAAAAPTSAEEIPQ